jgi:hypothetical protein
MHVSNQYVEASASPYLPGVGVPIVEIALLKLLVLFCGSQKLRVQSEVDPEACLSAL